jgi:hypothetical protein
VGEAGREYIIPESKMAAASANYLSGARGKRVMASPARKMAAVGFLGGMWDDSGQRAAGVGFLDGSERKLGGILINLKGPVVQMDNQNYVTVDQFRQGINEAVGQSVRAMTRTVREDPGLRRQLRKA